MRPKSLIIVCMVVVLALAGCKKAPTAMPTALPTNTAIPTNTPIPPTETPVPTPTATPVPPLDPAGLDNLSQVNSVKIVENTTIQDVAADQPGEKSSTTIYEIINQPRFYHLMAKESGATVDMLGLFGITEGNELTIDMYDNDDTLVLSAGTVFEYIRKNTQIMSEVLESMDIASAMGMILPEYEGLGISEGYEFLQWLGPLSFEGVQTINDAVCWEYTFDQASLLVEKLPEGMVVTEVSGSMCVAEIGNYLVHMEVSMSGQKLYLSSPEGDFTGTVDHAVEDGSLTYSLDISMVDQISEIKVPDDLIAKMNPPADVLVYEGAEVQMVVTGIMGINMYIYQTDADIQLVSDFYTTEMPNLGWTLSATETSETDIFLQFSKENQTYAVAVGLDPNSGQNMIMLMDMTSMPTP